MSRVLVTGASGFIGSHLCRRLLEEGAEVHCVSRLFRRDPRIRWWRADLTEACEVATLVERLRPDTIYHLAGYVSGSRALDAVLPTLNHNLVAAVNVLVAAARHARGPVVLAGSMEEPEPTSGDPFPVSPYAAAKYAAGSYARMFAALHHVPAINLRVFMVYGPAQENRTKLVPHVVTSLLRGERPKLASGVREVDWVYVTDVVDAFLAAACKAELAGETIDVGSGQLVTIRAVVERIAQLVGDSVEPEFGVVPDRPYEMVRAADVDRTRDLLGWEAGTPLIEGLRTTIEWYRAQLHAVQDGVRA